ncbi:putative polysaccharide biosynthesis protein [Scheffersomyces xylosifermentans]|uniref:putative polysaccharide biosynthesis protein n=1 Tax=Scheffersomyces xylosifermentans TaxID=1304137 RepID=UPI00315CD893
MAQPFQAETADNLEEIEKQFAVKAVVQAETYWGLLEKIPGSTLKLTKHDDDIFEQLLADFPEFKEPANVAEIKESEMKSVTGKKRWREFCEKFNQIEDYNFGTLLRTNAKDYYTQEGTIFAVRIQFYAIEIARNRYGLNDWVKLK